MGFSFRKKIGGPTVHPTERVEGATTTGFSNSEEAIEINPEAGLKKFKQLHKWDPFMDIGKLDAADEVLRTGDLEKEAAVETSLLEEDSPYPEVRASVS